MNNKGFAVTGILYTLLILFLLILSSFLAGLKAKNNYLAKSISSFDETFICDDEDVSNEDYDLAPYTGRYTYSNSNEETWCYAYIGKGELVDANDVTFTTFECNNEKDGLELAYICSFEEVNNEEEG